MIALDAIAARRDEVERSADLTALRDRLIVRAEPVLARMPTVPAVKALLSRDGGFCPDDGTPLLFDPWSPDQHKCPRCQRTFSGERHHAHWARAQHLWLAERSVHLATVFTMTDDARAASRARELLAAYHQLYFDLPNKDNVLGPTHPFFSTYLESIWILNYIGAAQLLRAAGALDDSEIDAVNRIADEAATIIGEFNEGMSNRQTWNAAALTALGVWFEDEELIRTAVESRTGLMGHLADGFGSDGMWYEGENYHLFALRGLLLGLNWAHAAGAEVLHDPPVAAHLGAALMAPSLTALPNFTFPARKDARYGVSLAHPAYLECWEAGFAWLGDHRPPQLAEWLQALYAVPAKVETTYDSYLHEGGETLGLHRTRSDLSSWALWTMAPELPAPAEKWQGKTRLLEQQGLAVLRRDDTYLSLECGGGGGGHGHPDRLHLTLHANGVHWLPDPGAGSYVARDLFWYRSTLSHNAPRLDGVDQESDEPAHCVAFDTGVDWQWMAGRWGDVTRRVVQGPQWIVDSVELESRDVHQLELPWHFNGAIEVETPGSWAPVELAGEFTRDAERFTANIPGPILLSVKHGAQTLRVWLVGDASLLRARGPGLPGTAADAAFLIQQATGRVAHFIAVLDLAGKVTNVERNGAAVTVHADGAVTTVQMTAAEAAVTTGGRTVALEGARPISRPLSQILADRPMVVTADALWTDVPPALDGTLAGFDRSAPLILDDETQYFRSEEPYPGAEEFSAKAYVNWDQSGLYLAVDVTKADLVLRSADAEPLLLDNESEDIHADGIQIYYQLADGAAVGWMIRPDPAGTLLTRPIDKTTPSSGRVTGAWQETKTGYRITVILPCPGLDVVQAAQPIYFDLIVNEMRSDRIRRAGQLIWSGGPGWVYLRGDRQNPSRFGELQLVG